MFVAAWLLLPRPGTIEDNVRWLIEENHRDWRHHHWTTVTGALSWTPPSSCLSPTALRSGRTSVDSARYRHFICMKTHCQQSSQAAEIVGDTNRNQQQQEPPQAFELREIERLTTEVKIKLQSIDDGALSVSAYDTAWVAMVKDIRGTGVPQFPSAIQWILNNQHSDGSWGDADYFSVPDRLCCTLASVVALKTWNLCPEKCDKGMSFVRQNLHKLKYEDPEHMLAAFEVRFPALTEMAQNLGLKIPEGDPVLQELYVEREQKLKRIPMEMLHSKPTTLLFSLEALTGLDWDKILKLQHSNGSFLCSASSTAFVLMQTKNEKCLEYLMNLVKRYNGGVPHSSPVDIFERLWVVDRLERLGIARYFRSEIRACLDYVYRHWTSNGISWARDTVELEIDSTSMAFRILRLHGFKVNADAYKHFERGGEFFCFVGQLSQGVTEMLSLYRASQVMFPGETILEEARKFSYKFLKQKHSSGQIADRWFITKDLAGEVKNYLEIPFYAMLPRIETRYYIDQYGGDDDVWIAKVIYRMYNVSNNLYLELSKLDYNHCQKLHQLEWIDIQRWYNDCNLREFGLSEEKLLQYYFVAMSNLFEPEKAPERLAWARTMALMEAISIHFCNEANTPIQRSIFLHSFQTSIDHDTIRRSKPANTKNSLVKSILKTLSIISSEVERAHSKEVHQSLKRIWEAWLLKWQNQEDKQSIPKGEAELLVHTINLSSSLPASQDHLFCPLFLYLIDLINKICYNLHGEQDLKAGKKDREEMRIDDLVEEEMLELLQHVVQTSNGLESKVKQVFIAVAKSFYYTTYIEADTIKVHIGKVLFDSAL
ncbi:hypothetical protein Sjap_007900 [Stephania japonica]|uniref:Uncharacterized protein n=1 Tax=Stephania japonica TaxID=461633 RepID=A0AAP0PDZ3_9MAGN